MIDKKVELKYGTKVRNIKYGTIEQVLIIGKMKDSNKGWIESVTYAGIDRFTKEYKVFTKSIEDFRNEFELIK